MESPSPNRRSTAEASDRRKSQRRKKQIQILYTGTDPKGQPMRGWLMDRSLGGLRMAVHTEVARGTRLNVCPANAGENAAWLAVIVRSCKPVEGSWELSCQFLREPSYSVLMQFG